MTQPISQDLSFQLGLQYTDQRSVGDQGLGDFTTWNVGFGGRILYRGLRVGATMHSFRVLRARVW